MPMPLEPRRFFRFGTSKLLLLSSLSAATILFVQAYQHWKLRNGEEPRLPGLDYTPEQIFYIRFGQVSASSSLAFPFGTQCPEERPVLSQSLY